ncbi:MAG: N-acetylmuramoyl-L-alanine amidase [Pseudomonadota bacterium]
MVVAPRLAALWLVFVTVIASADVKSAYAAEEVSEPAVAFAARIVGDQNRSRLIMDFDRAVEQTTYLLADPARLIVDVSRTVFSLGKVQLPPKSFVQTLRYGGLSGEKSRVVITLGGPVTVERTVLTALPNREHHRLIVDLVTADEKTFLAAVEKAPKLHPQDRASNKRAQKPKQPEKLTIVLDPGHGGRDGGAVGQRKTIEKDIVLKFAKRLKTKLEKVPNLEVLLTRDRDKFLSLTQRIEFARSNNADLLLSIHADSLRQRYIRGATVYTLSDRGSDEVSRSLVDGQNRAELVAGLQLPDQKPVVTDILIDLTRRETEVFSRKFASLLVQRFSDEIRLLKNPHRSADFFVLKAPEIPSVLLELGYLSNAKDEKLMQDPKWHEKAANRTRDAILGFFGPRLASQ